MHGNLAISDYLTEVFQNWQASRDELELLGVKNLYDHRLRLCGRFDT